jgi:NitT/TauT family transport system permease protein
MRLMNRHPAQAGRLILPMLPFILLIGIYALASFERLAENSQDKLLPGIASFAEAITRMAATPDSRTGQYLLWVDTGASLGRLSLGLVIATLVSALVGFAVGILPYLRILLAPFIAILAMIPPLAILPILFIMLGLGEVSKVALIVIGIAPYMIRDLALRVGELPGEQLVKAQTLGASTWQVAVRVVIPQMLPRLIDSVRLSLGSAWLYLIAAEAIAAENGLGYRIFLVRRYLAMDVILPYVAWITLLAFLLDLALRRFQHRVFPWFAGGRGS